MSEIFELELTGMAYGAAAIGRHEGKVIFVPYGMVGERVRVQMTQDKGKFAQAVILEILQAHPARIAPRCVHFGVCGGCHYQHLDYPAQLLVKQQIVREQLARVGGFRDAIVHPTIPSPQAWEYRSHVSFHSTHDGRLGFVSADNQMVIPIQACHIIHADLFTMMQENSPQPLAENQRLRLQMGDTEKVAAKIQAVDEDTSSHTSQAAKIHYIVKGKKFQATVGSFFQVNLPQAETLVTLVLEKAALQGHERVLDLYAGVGLFTAFLAEHARQVTAIESSLTAVQDAQVNLAGFQNVDVLQGKAEILLARKKFKSEVVVTDPPRTGMKPAVIEAILKTKPQKIIYVSCDPTTLARDSRRLADNGYQLQEVQPVDMFPQTYHIESVAVLVR